MGALDDWIVAENTEIQTRQAAITAQIPKLISMGWTLLSAGAYFAYLRHPFPESSDQLAPRLVRDAAILALPGTMFRPIGDPLGSREFRIAIANIDAREIAELFSRLQTFTRTYN